MADDATRPEGTEENRDNARETEEVRALKSTLRFLVSNSDAGSIIGKGGVVISEFQTQSGAKIVLSRAREYFPNTTDRIILLSGSVSAILTALHLILSKLADEPRRNEPGAREGDVDLRIVVPNRVCGAIIGKGGATIRSFVEDSQATIKLSPQDAAGPGFAERLITIGGTLEQKLRAVALLLTKMSEDPTYVQYADVPLSYTGAGGRGGFNGGPGGYGGGGGYGQGQGGYPGYPNTGGYGGPPFGGLRGPPPYGMPGLPPNRGKAPPAMLPGGVVPTTIIVAVPDDHVGAVVGKAGRSINEIQQTTGVRMVISDRNDYVEGTRDRKVTITGSSEGVVAAQHMIAQKVQQSIAAGSGDRHGGGHRDEKDDGPPPGL
ncbi:hypothetical protein CLOM_g21088 [Closterium sp. NIES-68]|nr:hypothetical protein CLOM_g21088 [Closterium sp. NIES-68]